MGFRGQEFTPQKASGLCRILGLGDSQTFGIGVEQHETYLSVLDSLLRDQYTNGSVEVINAGVGGWGTSQELAFLEDMDDQFSPDLILIGLNINDARDSFNTQLYRINTLGDLEPVPMNERPEWFPEKTWITELPSYDFFASNSALFNWTRNQYTRFRAGAMTPEVNPEILYESEWLNLQRLLMRQLQELESEWDTRIIFVL